MRQVAGVLPVKNMNNTFLTAFNPHTAYSGIRWKDLLVITLLGPGISCRRRSPLPLDTFVRYPTTNPTTVPGGRGVRPVR